MELAELPAWPRFLAEQARLVGALGKITAGGSVEKVVLIGASAVPGLPRPEVMTLGVSAWPFPLEPGQVETLAQLGYLPLPATGDEAEQRFSHATKAIRLHLMEPGSQRWDETLLLRDFLNHNPQALTMAPDAEPDPTAAPWQPVVAAAYAWWVAQQSFAPVEAVADVLRDFPHPWCIASGWALDLFLGQVSRFHHDVDVTIPRANHLALQTYLGERGWEFVTPFKRQLEPWPPHMFLTSPRHQIHAHRDDDFIDFLLSDVDAGIWRYRRNPRVVRPVEQVVQRNASGIPFLAPEVVLLFKSHTSSGGTRPKDLQDFERLKGELGAESRAWLAWALVATVGDHPWLPHLLTPQREG